MLYLLVYNKHICIKYVYKKNIVLKNYSNNNPLQWLCLLLNKTTYYSLKSYFDQNFNSYYFSDFYNLKSFSTINVNFKKYYEVKFQSIIILGIKFTSEGL